MRTTPVWIVVWECLYLRKGDERFMNSIEGKLYRAVAQTKRPRPLKFLNPGIAKFVVRYLGRAKAKGTVKRAKLFFLVVK